MGETLTPKLTRRGAWTILVGGLLCALYPLGLAWAGGDAAYARLLPVPFVLMAAGLVALSFELRARMERSGVVGVALTLVALLGVLVGSAMETVDTTGPVAPAGRALWLTSIVLLAFGSALLGGSVARLRDLPDARMTGAILGLALPTGAAFAVAAGSFGAFALALGLLAPYGLAYALLGARWLDLGRAARAPAAA